MTTPRRTFPDPPQRPTALLIQAHPSDESFTAALASAFEEGAKAKGMAIDRLTLSQLDFELARRGGYKDESTLEPDLVRSQEAIANAAHLVIAFPLWWGSTPAVLKGFFDRALLPGWAFSYNEKTGLPVGGLAGRSGRLLVTMDAPVWYDTVFNRASARRQVRTATLKFCGLSPVRTSAFGGIKTSTEERRTAMLAAARRAGETDAKEVLRRFPQSLPAPTPAL